MDNKEIVEVAYELAEKYNNIIEAISAVNKPLGYEHISTEKQNLLLNEYKAYCVNTLSWLIDETFVNFSIREDAKAYEERNGGKSVSRESVEVATVLFSACWLRFLVEHCGERKEGFYLQGLKLTVDGFDMGFYNNLLAKIIERNKNENKS